jgi:hypothetical protein
MVQDDLLLLGFELLLWLWLRLRLLYGRFLGWSFLCGWSFCGLLCRSFLCFLRGGGLRGGFYRSLFGGGYRLLLGFSWGGLRLFIGFLWSRLLFPRRLLCCRFCLSRSLIRCWFSLLNRFGLNRSVFLVLDWLQLRRCLLSRFGL